MRTCPTKEKAVRKALVVVVALLVTACTGLMDETGSGQSGQFQGNPPMVAGGAVGADSTNASGGLCVIPDFYCPGGKICFEGYCKENECKDWPGCDCGSCRAECVPTKNPCSGLTCVNGTTCVDGRCIPGCFDVPCADKECGQGEYCSNGSCRKVIPAPGVKCKPGYVGTLVECADNPCKGVTCGEGKSCVGGSCVVDKCAGVTCVPGWYCKNGLCYDSCTGASGAAPGGPKAPVGTPPACVPKCTGACGSPNGCGGICKVGSCAPGYGCQNGKCVCVPTCSGKGCGEGDGCGGTCKTGCAPGQKCISSGSAWLCCTPDCTGKACGEGDGCGGTCSSGTCAGPQEVCKSGKCVCVPECVNKGCGEADGCNSICKGGCETDQECINDGTAWLCCTPDCTGKICGGDDGCGGKCSTGTCANMNEFCKSGKCVCQPDCTSKGCGADNGCGGVCKACAQGKCIQSGGVWGCCVASCVGKACGASDGCGGTCKTGSCPSGTSCDNGKCVAPPPPTSCPCGQKLVGGKCVPLCAADETLCGCTACCGPFSTCDWMTSTCKGIN
jgi:hypothetical protein